MNGLYGAGGSGDCVCGHPAREHERVGFKKRCLVPRCACSDLDLGEDR